jgi:hypothetical protein
MTNERKTSNPKEGTLLDKDLEHNNSNPKRDVYSPPHREVVPGAPTPSNSKLGTTAKGGL